MLLKLPPDEILIRWLNHHLAKVRVLHAVPSEHPQGLIKAQPARSAHGRLSQLTHAPCTSNPHDMFPTPNICRPQDGSKTRVKNLSGDMRDGLVYAHVLHSIAPELAPTAASLAASEPLHRATMVRCHECMCDNVYPCWCERCREDAVDGNVVFLVGPVQA